jgi:hypothetical protein
MNIADMRADGAPISPTGRLVRNEPKLQNIPVRTEEAARIRGALFDFAAAMKQSAQSGHNFSTAAHADAFSGIFDELK